MMFLVLALFIVIGAVGLAARNFKRNYSNLQHLASFLTYYFLFLIVVINLGVF